MCMMRDELFVAPLRVLGSSLSEGSQEPVSPGRETHCDCSVIRSQSDEPVNREGSSEYFTLQE